MSTEEQQNEPAVGGVTRDDLIEAVRAAGGVESVADDDAVMRAGQQPAEEPAAPAVVETPAEEEDRIDRIMKARAKAHAETMAARNAADEIRREAERERARIIEEAKAEARRAVEQENAERRSRLDANPIEGLRELGRDPTQMVDAVLAANTPEARERARLAAEVAATREDARVGRSAKEELERFKSALEQERLQTAIAQYNAHFLATTASPEKAPYLHARFEPEEIVARARAVAEDWVRDGLKYKVDFDDELVTAYLERQSKERIVKVAVPPATPAQQVSAGAVGRPPGNAPQVSANGSRTLSAAQGSERRSSPKPFADLTPAQKRADLIALVADTRRRNPDAY